MDHPITMETAGFISHLQTLSLDLTAHLTNYPFIAKPLGRGISALCLNCLSLLSQFQSHWADTAPVFRCWFSVSILLDLSASFVSVENSLLHESCCTWPLNHLLLVPLLSQQSLLPGFLCKRIVWSGAQPSVTTLLQTHLSFRWSDTLHLYP